VVLDGKTGETITKKGRAKVSSESFLEDFPYRPKSFTGFTDLFGGKLLNGENEVETADVLKDCDYVFIYFSAHWCPPCRGFTPKWAENYKALKAAGKKFDCVFASSDKDEEAFNGYYKEMPWLALPFSERKTKAALAEEYECSGIPHLVVLDKKGNVVTLNGRAGVSSADFVEDFPYLPKACYDVAECMDGITDGFSLLLVQNLLDKDTKAKNSKMFKEVAKEHLDQDKPYVSKFFTVNGGGPVDFVRDQTFCPKVMENPGEGYVKMDPKSTYTINGQTGIPWQCDACTVKHAENSKERWFNEAKSSDYCEVCWEKCHEEKSEEDLKPFIKVLDLKNESFYDSLEKEITKESV